MRTPRDKALMILNEETEAAGLELVVDEYRDGSGVQLYFQRPDEFVTLAYVSSSWNAEEFLKRGRNALQQAVKKL